MLVGGVGYLTLCETRCPRHTFKRSAVMCTSDQPPYVCSLDTRTAPHTTRTLRAHGVPKKATFCRLESCASSCARPEPHRLSIVCRQIARPLEHRCTRSSRKKRRSRGGDDAKNKDKDKDRTKEKSERRERKEKKRKDRERWGLFRAVILKRFVMGTPVVRLALVSPYPSYSIYPCLSSI